MCFVISVRDLVSRCGCETQQSWDPTVFGVAEPSGPEFPPNVSLWLRNEAFRCVIWVFFKTHSCPNRTSNSLAIFETPREKRKCHPKNGRFAADQLPENESCNLTLQAGPPLLGNARSVPPKLVHCAFVQQTSNPSYRVVAGLNWKAQCLQCFETLPWSPCFKPVLSEDSGPKSLKCGITLSYFSAYPTFRPTHIEDMDSQGL